MRGYHAFYLAWLSLYVTVGLILLAGFSSVQYYCEHNEGFFVQYTTGTYFVSPSIGGDCDKLFRFAWTVIWLGVLPLPVDIAGMIASKNGIDMGRGAWLFAVIAALDVLMANWFFNMVDTAQNFGPVAVSPFPYYTTATMEERFRSATAGFSMRAAFSLLMLCLTPWTLGKRRAHVQST